jgi:hypothetical protein
MRCTRHISPSFFGTDLGLTDLVNGSKYLEVLVWGSANFNLFCHHPKTDLKKKGRDLEHQRCNLFTHYIESGSPNDTVLAFINVKQKNKKSVLGEGLA